MNRQKLIRMRLCQFSATHITIISSCIFILLFSGTALCQEAVSAPPASSASSFPWEEYFSYISGLFGTVWNYEIFSTVDNRPITVRKVVIGFFLLILGYLMARYLSHLFAKRILSRFRLTESVTAIIQTVFFYVLVFLFALFALHVANVPLTVFTVLGGALAIGVGFGSQNVVNNFMSGLILFTERPIKVGDLLDIDGTYGRVKSIGARSTVIRTSANIDIIVPNSAFLEKQVVNWTRSDTNVRLHVSVGVAYGSPTDTVSQLLREAAESNSAVLRKNEIIVLFVDFGDNALIFEVHFWAQIRTMMEKRMLESEIRFKIDKLCRDRGVTIAFPQRDVHMESLKPIEVKILGQDLEKL
ncbi:mechanosensitive ion channel [bacterium]|nr:mechanosensitive ion channel [bacterium]